MGWRPKSPASPYLHAHNGRGSVGHTKAKHFENGKRIRVFLLDKFRKCLPVSKRYLQVLCPLNTTLASHKARKGGGEETISEHSSYLNEGHLVEAEPWSLITMGPLCTSWDRPHAQREIETIEREEGREKEENGDTGRKE